MCFLVSSSARATSVAAIWAQGFRAVPGSSFLLRTMTNLCVVLPVCGAVNVLAFCEIQGGRADADRPSINRTLAPPEEAKVPGVSLTRGRLSNKTRGWTLPADGGDHDGYRCDAHWCLRRCPCIPGDLLCAGGSLFCRVLLLNVGGQLAWCPFSGPVSRVSVERLTARRARVARR